MKIKTNQWGVFYRKANGKWVGPAHEELNTKKHLREDYGSAKKFLKGVRKHFHRPVKLMRMVWVS